MDQTFLIAAGSIQASTPLEIIFITIDRFSWPLFAAITLWTAILFFRADRRWHTLCLLIGAILWALTSWWSFLLEIYLPDLLDRIHKLRHYYENYYRIHTGVAVIAQGLICFGLLMIAIIHFRKSRLSEFEAGGSEK